MKSNHSCSARFVTVAIGFVVACGNLAEAQSSAESADYLIGVRPVNVTNPYFRELPKTERASGGGTMTAAKAVYQEAIVPQSSLILPVQAQQVGGGYFRSVAPAIHAQELVDSPPAPPAKKVSNPKVLGPSTSSAQRVGMPAGLTSGKAGNQDKQDETANQDSSSKDTADDEESTNDDDEKSNAEPETNGDDEDEKTSSDSASPRWVRKSLRDVKIDIRETAVVAPKDRSRELDYGIGDWFAFNGEPKVFAWCAPNIRYQPLYFEDVALERYGQTLCPRPQTFRSGVHFFRSAFLLPHKMRHDRPGSCDYPLGFCRPGTTTPLTDQRHYFGRPR